MLWSFEPDSVLCLPAIFYSVGSVMQRDHAVSQVHFKEQSSQVSHDSLRSQGERDRAANRVLLDTNARG